MLQKAGRLANLKALLKSHNLPEEVQELTNLVYPQHDNSEKSHQKPIHFQDDEYQILLQYLSFTYPERSWYHYNQPPSHNGAGMVVTPWHISHTHLHHKGTTYSNSTKHKGNSIISYWHGGSRYFGVIVFMFTLVDPYQQIPDFFLVISPIQVDPHFLLDWPHLNIFCVAEIGEDKTIINSNDIEGHCALFISSDQSFSLLVHLNLLLSDYVEQ
jgi:hypothetical protein